MSYFIARTPGKYSQIQAAATPNGGIFYYVLESFNITVEQNACVWINGKRFDYPRTEKDFEDLVKQETGIDL